MKQAVRSLWKHRFQTVASLSGLVMGLVCVAYSANWIWNELNYDSFRRNYSRVYAVACKVKLDDPGGATEKDSARYAFSFSLTGPMYVRMREAVPQGDDCAIVQGNTYMYEVEKEDGAAIHSMLTVVDSTFAEIVDLQALAGDPRAALARPDGMVITRDVAVRHFGSPENAMGAKLRLVNGDEPAAVRPYTVQAVVADCPERLTNHGYEVLVARFTPTEELAGQPENNHTHGLLVATDRPEETARLMQAANDAGGGKNTEIKLVPLRYKHLLEMKQGAADWPGTADIVEHLAYPMAFLGVSLLLLLSACFNYLAILTSLYQTRVREYALRIGLGASFRHNAAWLLAEVPLMLLLCLLLSGAVMEWVNRLTDLPEAAQGSYRSLYVTTGVFAVLLLVGVQFPVWRMKRIYRERFTTHKPRGRVSAGLLFVQFAVCSLLLFVLSTAYRQLHGLFTADLGFRTENLLRIPTQGGYEYAVYDHAFFEIARRLNEVNPSAIEAALAMQSDLFESTGRSMSAAGRFGVADELYRDNRVRELTLPYEALDFFGLKLLRGTWFRPPVVPEQVQQVLLNPEAAAALDTDERGRDELTFPAERYFDDGHCEETRLPMPVRGILSFRTHSLHEAQEPLVIFCSPDGRTNFMNQTGHACIYVKHRPGREAEARAAVRATLEAFDVPKEIIKMERMDDYVRGFYDKERNYLLLFSVVSAGGVAVTLLGVLSMVLYTLRTERRAIAVRRVFGADFGRLCRHYLRAYLALALAGCVAAFPMGLYVMNRWLEGYNVRVDVGWWQMPVIFFVEAAAVVWIVAAQVRRVMREHPARVLSCE